MTEEERAQAKQERNEEIAQLLAAGFTQAQIRERTGASERTIRRLLGDEKFRAMVRRARHQRAEDVNRRIAGMVDEALTALEWLVRHADSSTVQLRAIKTVLEVDTRLQIEALAAQLDQLERAVAAKSQWTPDPLPGEDGADDLPR